MKMGTVGSFRREDRGWIGLSWEEQSYEKGDMLICVMISRLKEKGNNFFYINALVIKQNNRDKISQKNIYSTW